jgi:hypothetical protein
MLTSCHHKGFKDFNDLMHAKVEQILPGILNSFYTDMYKKISISYEKIEEGRKRVN